MSKLEKVLKGLRTISLIFTLIYMWVASCIYLAYNVNNMSANACFYGGVVTIILFVSTSPSIQNVVKR